MIQARFFTFSTPLLGLVAITALIFAGAGCSGPSRNNTREELMKERPVAMKGEDQFLGGDIVATVTVSKGFRHERSRNASGFKQDTADQIMEQIGGLNSDDPNYYKDIGQILALEVRGSRMDPISSTLRLTNRTNREIDLEISEFNSALGNFSVQPGKVKLGPEETVQVDPMSSQLGFGDSVLPVKITLKAADGRTDGHTVQVKSVLPADFDVKKL